MIGPGIEEIFGEALALSPDERTRYLGSLEPRLRTEVESLLEAHGEAGGFMGEPSVVSEPPAGTSHGEGEGEVIGRYKLLQRIGEGGFGSVFMAEQREPVVRRVALKIIKLGMDTRQVIARFEAERQALAMMDHPGIARVFDAGATDAGRPYFVMELVRGESITAYCDNVAMDIRGRLELFQQVCHAVQHAHQKGIIHRDLKPSNILVSEIDGRPAPKIIDFGIAKATGGAGALTDKTLFTDFRQFVGTPEYMSPEQAGMAAVDIDTRSDIYSLGVLLYELLTGGPPFDAKKLRSAAWDEMRRIIRADQPQRPSTRLHSTTGTREIAARRKTEPAQLVGLVRGDLDWIVMKCLEKDRARRYETANGLAMDVERHLKDEPVTAGPPGAMYRLRKLLRRRRGPVITGAVGAILLLGATVLTTSMWLRASENARRAGEAEASATDRLWESLVAQSRARRRTLEMGRRFDSLEIIRRAAAIRPSLEVRNEAIAALALLDAQLVASTPEYPLPTNLSFTPSPDWVLVQGPSGIAERRRPSDNTLLGVIPRPMVGGDWIYGTSFSSDGSRVALRTKDDAGKIVVSVWDITEGIPEANYLMEEVADNDFALSPEGDLLAVVGGGRLRMLDVPSGEERWSREAPPDSFLYFRPGHNQISIAPQFQSKLQLLNAQTGEQEADLILPGEVGGMCWSLTGDRVALGCADFAVRVGTGADLESWVELRGHQGLATELSFDPDGEFLLSDSWDSTARIWDLVSEQCILVLPAGKAWPSLSREALVGYQRRKPRSYRFQSFSLARPVVFRPAAAGEFSRGATEAPFLADHPTLPCLVTGSRETHRLVFWTSNLDRVIGSCEVSPIAAAAFSPAGDLLYTTGDRGLEARPVSLKDGTLRIGPARVLDPDWRDSFDLSDLGRIAVGFKGSRDAVSLELGGAGAAKAKAKALPASAGGIDVSPDGRFAAFSTWHDPDVAVWDLTDDSIRTLGLQGPAHARFSPDGRFLAASTWGSDHVYKTDGWGTHAVIDVPDSIPFPAHTAFSHDGALYARVLDSNRVRLFQTASFDELCTLESPDLFGIRCVAFTRDDRGLVALTNRANAMYVWDLPALRAELREMGLDWSDAPIPQTPVLPDAPRIERVVQLPP